MEGPWIHAYVRAVVVGVGDDWGGDPSPLGGRRLGHVEAEHQDGQIVEEVHQAGVGREVTRGVLGGGRARSNHQE